MKEFEIIKQDCAVYLELLRKGKKGCFLVHAVKNDSINIEKFNYDVGFRKPKDTPIHIHDEVNLKYLDKFGWNVRNGIFTYGVSSNFENLDMSPYGVPYLFFPCGDFEYVFDYDVFDLFEFYYDSQEINPKEFVRKINYINYDLSTVMQTVNRGCKSVEIIINCKKYYLVNFKYLNQLLNYIWN